MSGGLQYFSLLILYVLLIYLVVLAIFLFLRRKEIERRKQRARDGQDVESAPLLVHDDASDGLDEQSSVILPLLTRVEDVSDSWWGGDGAQDLLFSTVELVDNQLNGGQSTQPNPSPATVRPLLQHGDRGRLLLFLWRWTWAVILLAWIPSILHSTQTRVLFYFHGWNVWLSCVYFLCSAVDSSIVLYYLRFIPLWKRFQNRRQQRLLSLARKQKNADDGEAKDDDDVEGPDAEAEAEEGHASHSSINIEPTATLHSTGNAIDTTGIDTAITMPTWSLPARYLAILSHLLFEIVGAMSIFDLITLVFGYGDNSVAAINQMEIVIFFALIVDMTLTKMHIRFDQFPATFAWFLCYLFYIWPTVVLGTLADWPYSIMRMDVTACFGNYTAIIFSVFVSFLLWYLLDQGKHGLIYAYKRYVDGSIAVNTTANALPRPAGDDDGENESRVDSDVNGSVAHNNRDSNNSNMLRRNSRGSNGMSGVYPHPSQTANWNANDWAQYQHMQQGMYSDNPMMRSMNPTGFLDPSDSQGFHQPTMYPPPMNYYSHPTPEMWNNPDFRRHYQNHLQQMQQYYPRQPHQPSTSATSTRNNQSEANDVNDSDVNNTIRFPPNRMSSFVSQQSNPRSMFSRSLMQESMDFIDPSMLEQHVPDHFDPIVQQHHDSYPHEHHELLQPQSQFSIPYQPSFHNQFLQHGNDQQLNPIDTRSDDQSTWNENDFQSSQPQDSQIPHGYQQQPGEFQYPYSYPQPEGGFQYPYPPTEGGFQYPYPQPEGGFQYPYPPTEGGFQYPYPPTEGGFQYPYPQPEGGFQYPYPPTEGGFQYPYPPTEGGFQYPYPPTEGGFQYPYPSTEGGFQYPYPPTEGGFQYPFPYPEGYQGEEFPYPYPSHDDISRYYPQPGEECHNPYYPYGEEFQYPSNMEHESYPTHSSEVDMANSNIGSFYDDSPSRVLSQRGGMGVPVTQNPLAQRGPTAQSPKQESTTGGSLIARIRAGATATLGGLRNRRPATSNPGSPSNSNSNSGEHLYNRVSENGNHSDSAYSDTFERHPSASVAQLSNRGVRRANRTASAMFGNTDADISMFGGFDDL
jgi:hypothetical protein